MATKSALNEAEVRALWVYLRGSRTVTEFERLPERVRAALNDTTHPPQAVPQYSVDVDDVEYRLAHGRTPRGRGGWCFCPSSEYLSSGYVDKCFRSAGTYSKARRAAKRYLAERGEREIAVCP